MKMLLPYDKKTMPVEIDDRNFAGSLVSKVESYKPSLSQHELVEASLDHPIGAPTLEELAKGKKNPVFGPTDSQHHESHQWTGAIEMLIKF